MIPLTRVSIVKDIGIFFDCKMLFDHHIQQITIKAKKSLGFIIRTSKDFKQIDSIRTLYMSYVNSVLSFGSVIWNPQYDVYIGKIEKIQDHFLKYLCYKFYLNGNLTLIKQNLRLLSLEDRRQMYDIKFAHKILNNMIDSTPIINLLNFNIPSYNTRNKFFFFIYNQALPTITLTRLCIVAANRIIHYQTWLTWISVSIP